MNVCGVIAQKMTEPENGSGALTQRNANLLRELSPCTTSPIQGVSGTNAEKTASREVFSEANLLNYFDLWCLSEPEYRPLDAGLSNVFCPNI